MEATLPRISRGPHLYLKQRTDGQPAWYIRDGKLRIATGCRQGDVQGARKAFEDHLGKTSKPQFGDGDPSRVLVASVLMLYGQDKIPKLARPEEAAQRFERLNEFFGNRYVIEISPTLCAAYTRWRTHGGAPSDDEPPRRKRAIAGPSVRRELADLQSALGHAFRSRKLLVPIPVELPPAARPRDTWLTRSEAARLLLGALGWQSVPACDLKTRKEIWVIWERHRDQINWHTARFIILGLRTGTRHDAICSLGWVEHVNGGYIDLDRKVLYRKSADEIETNKRRRPVQISTRFAAQLRRWRKLDGRSLYIVSWKGKPIDKIRRSFASAVKLAGLSEEVTPHILKHTSISWAVQSGTYLWEIADFYSTSVKMIETVYGHHIPGRHDNVLKAIR